MIDHPISLSLLSEAAGTAAESGREVRPAITRAVLSGVRGPGALVALSALGKPWLPDAVVLTLDFHAPEVESRLPRARTRSRALAQEFGLTHVFDLNAGIGSLVALEWGLVQPGDLVAGCGRCLGVVGGVGALGLRLEETDLAQSMTGGTVSLRAPEVVGVDVCGKAPRHVGPWDVAKAAAGALGNDLAGRVVEFHGSVDGWSVEFRCSLCGILAEMGAVGALVAPDQMTEAFYETRGIQLDGARAPSATGAFTSRIELDLETVVPLAGTGYNQPAVPVVERTDTPIHGAFIGSCYGGGLGDLAVAAEILRKAGQVDPGVRLTISPATLEVARAALNAGYYEVFFGAGAMVTAPGMGAGNVGGGAILGEGEHLAATAGYHRPVEPGQGSPEVTLLGPAAAAAAAVAGRLIDPADFTS